MTGDGRSCRGKSVFIPSNYVVYVTVVPSHVSAQCYSLAQLAVTTDYNSQPETWSRGLKGSQTL